MVFQTMLKGGGDSDDLSKSVPNLKVKTWVRVD